MSQPFAIPVPLSEQSFFEARNEKVTFVNPKGSEVYGRAMGFKPPEVDDQYAARKKRWSLNGQNLARQGRPVK